MIKTFLLAAAAAVACATPLDDYVNKPDDHYQYVDTGLRLNGTNLNGDLSWTGYVLNMTSQQWLTPEDTDRSIWWHWVVMFVPSNLDPQANDWGFIWCTGGGNTMGAPSATDEDVVVASYVAMQTGTVAMTLYNVPNEHMVFSSDPTQQSRTEDAILAYGWAQYLDGADAEWIPQLPMAKAGVRAVDTLIDWSKEQLDCDIAHVGFAGASKRGWTTWLTAAVDPRIDAFVPVVMDMLNIRTVLKKHQMSLGGWSFAFEDYYDMNITARLDEDRTTELFSIVDPIEYADRFADRPKFVCDATGDEFFLLTDWLSWKDQVPGPLYQLMAPNTEHSFATGVLELLPAVSSWVGAIKYQQKIPQVTWEINNSTGEITMTADTQPLRVNAWSATTCGASGARDFRLASAREPCRPCGISVDDMCIQLSTLWSLHQLDADSPDLTWTYSHSPSDGVYTGFVLNAVFPPAEAAGQLDWPIDHPGNFEFTSGVSVVDEDGLPNTYPFPECEGTGCYLTLV